MPISDISLGRDMTITVMHALAPSGGRLDLQIVTGFDSKENRKKIQVPGLDGRTRTAYVPESYDMTIETSRGNNEMDLFFSALDTAYRAGVNIPTGAVYTTVLEADGSTTTTLYDKVSFTRNDSGKWTQDSDTKQSFMGTAETKQVIS